MLLKKFDTSNLRLRMMSAAILSPAALLAIWLGGLAYGAVVTCVIALGLYEWLRLAAPHATARLIGTTGFLAMIALTFGVVFSLSSGAALCVLFTLVVLVLARREVGGEVALWMAFGLPYMVGSGLALLSLRDVPQIGMALTFYLIAVVWATDVGAFACGRLIGGPRLAPVISPNKTWAGLVGGIVFAVLAGYLVARLAGAQHPFLTLLVSTLTAAVAQAGDLFESYFKRRAGVKESGDLIPGHGGVLDRIDGLVFAALFLALFQSFLGQQLQWW